MSRRKRPTYTPKAPSKAKQIPVPEELQGRRRPRKQDFAAAAIALVIVLAMLVSAVSPFFM